MDAVKTALGCRILSQNIGNRFVNVMVSQRLGAIIRETIERRLRREPIAAGFLIQISRTLAQFPKSFTENGKLVARLGASKPETLTGKPRIWLADQWCRTKKDRPGGTSGSP
jgi:hypothetical protein